jgi:hypothetical protein
MAPRMGAQEGPPPAAGRRRQVFVYDRGPLLSGGNVAHDDNLPEGPTRATICRPWFVGAAGQDQTWRSMAVAKPNGTNGSEVGDPATGAAIVCCVGGNDGFA